MPFYPRKITLAFNFQSHAKNCFYLFLRASKKEHAAKLFSSGGTSEFTNQNSHHHYHHCHYHASYSVFQTIAISWPKWKELELGKCQQIFDAVGDTDYYWLNKKLIKPVNAGWGIQLWFAGMPPPQPNQ